MGANVWPVDAVTGAPSYTGRILRQLASAWARNPARPLCARSGVAVGTPTTIATCPTSTTYQVTPFGGVIDGETSAVAGAYNFSFDSNQTGTVNAADATNPRLDLLYVRVSDPAEGDGTAAPIIELLYLAGTAAASPTVPATPARSMPVWSILVPHVGAGSPVVSFIGSWAVASGGVAPVASSGGYPASPYNGQIVYNQATDTINVYNGTGWDQFTKSASIRVENGVATMGTFTTAGATYSPTTYDLGVSCQVGDLTYSAGVITVGSTGVYRWSTTNQAPAATLNYRVRSFILKNGSIDGGGQSSQQWAPSEGSGWITAGELIPCNAGDTLQSGMACSAAGLAGVLPTSFSVARVA